MARAAAIIVNKNSVALIKRQREGRTYYVFPGGGVEEGESPEQAAIREVREELGLDVCIEQLVAELIYMRGSVRRTRQYYYLMRVTGGEFGTGQGPEMLGLYPPQSGTYTPIWMPIGQVARETVYPVPVARMVLESTRQGWPDDAIHFEEDV